MSSPENLISIIIATFNSAKTLEKCLQSIINQSYNNYEIIVIDGSSTDRTVEIIKRYDKFIAKWISEKDNGIYDAWNKGVQLSKGDWISFIGSDDEFYQDALASYSEFLGENSNLDYLSSKLNLVNVKGEQIKTLGLPWNWKTCRLQNVVAHPGSLHHRHLFDKFGLYDTSYKISADFEFLLRGGKEMNVGFLDKITVKMQQGGVSTQNAKVYKEHYLAATTTGRLSKSTGRFFFLYQNFKFQVKSLIRKMGYDI